MCLLLFPEVKNQCKIGINFSSADVVTCVEVANRFIKNDFARRRICYTLRRMAKCAQWYLGVVSPTKNSIVSIVVSTPFSPEVKDQCKIGINFSSADERQSTQMSSVHVRSATGYATEM